MGNACIEARIRATHRLKTPDALHATAVAHAGVTALVTDDAGLERLDAFEILLLDRLLEP